MKNSIYVLFLCLLVSTQAFSQDSVYVYLKSKPVSKFAIVDIDSIKFEKPIQYSYFISKANSQNFSHYSTFIPLFYSSQDFNIAYNNTSRVNLNNLVEATASNGMLEKRFADYGLGVVGVNYKFVFSSSFNYMGVDGVTNQNSYIQILSDGTISVVGGSSSIDRFPLVSVQLQDMTGKVLAQAYIKFKITIPPPPIPVSKTFTYPQTISYSTLFKGISTINQNITEFRISDQQMNEIYSMMGITHNEYLTFYLSLTPNLSVKVNNVSVSGATLSQYPLFKSFVETNDAPARFLIQITPMAKFGNNVLTYTLTPSDTRYPVLNLIFSYTVMKPMLDKSIIPAFQYNNSNAILTQGLNTSGGWKMQLYLGEAFGFGSSSLKDMFGVGSNNKIDGATHQFIVADNYVKASVPSYILSNATSASISGLLGTAPGTGCLMEMNPANPLDLTERTYTVNFKTIYPNAESDDFNYSVIFRTPLSIELEATADFDLLDNKTGAKDQIDLTKNYVVKMLGDVVFDKTGVSSKAAVYGLGTSIRTYTATNVNPSFAYAFSFSSPVLTWENPGSRLVSTQKICDAVFTYTAPFARIILSNTVKVNPQ